MKKHNFHSVRRWGAVAAIAAAGAGLLNLAGCDSSTGPAPYTGTKQLLLTSPTGGEIFYIGDTLTVTWDTTGKSDLNGTLGEVDVELSPDNGKYWVYLNQSSLPPGSSPFKWKIADTVSFSGLNLPMDGDTCLLRVQEYVHPEDSNKVSTTPAPFFVKAH